MEFIGNIGLGLSVVLQPEYLLYCFIGVFVGTFVGVLPGVGSAATIAMLIPITFSMGPTGALIMLAGIYYGAQYGGSTASILLNVPGDASAAVIVLDGHPMAKNGRAGAALAISALASFFAGTVCTFAIAFLAAPLASVALRFNSADYFSLMVLGLIGSIALVQGSLLKAFGMIIIGLLLGLVGTDLFTGAQRFTMGFVELSDGVGFVPVVIGMFGLAEILRNLERYRPGGDGEQIIPVGRLRPSWEETRRSALPTARGTLLGAILGILPGTGATIASFMSYAVEKRIARDPSRFGKGAVEGVAAPEAATNAAAQTAFIPMLALGIPSTPNIAIIMGALLIQGFAPGPTVMTNHPEFFWAVVVSMWIGNAILLVLNLPLIPLWVKVLQIPYGILFPAVIAFCAIGTYSFSSNIFDIYMVSLAGLGGYLLSKCDCEPAPLVLGLVLGPMVEEHFRRALMVSNGDPAIFIQRPISACLLLVSVALLVLAASSVFRKRPPTNRGEESAIS